jgi:hypothetical protein
MFAISTSDYALSRGDRCSSPCASDEERFMFRKNQMNKRKIIEEELNKIPENERNNLIILMKCLYSYYVEQLIEVKIVNKNEKYDELKMLNTPSSDFDEKYVVYTPYIDASVYPEIWNDFDNNPFYTTCEKCNNVLNKIHNSFKNYEDECDICKNKKIHLLVPYEEKEEAKELGAKWDKCLKKWYILNCNKNKDLIFQKWKAYNMQCINHSL